MICREELGDDEQEKIEYPCHRSQRFCLECFPQLVNGLSRWLKCTICKKRPNEQWFINQMNKITFASLKERSDCEGRYLALIDPQFSNYSHRPTPPSDIPSWAILHDDFPYMVPNAIYCAAVAGGAGALLGGTLTLGGCITVMDAMRLVGGCAGGLCCFNMFPFIFPRQVYLEDEIELHMEWRDRKERNRRLKLANESENRDKNI